MGKKTTHLFEVYTSKKKHGFWGYRMKSLDGVVVSHCPAKFSTAQEAKDDIRDTYADGISKGTYIITQTS